MGYLSKELEITSPLPPAKIFKALVLDADELFPKILPQAFKSVEIIEGDGIGAGSVKKIVMGEAEHFKHVTHKVDLLDKEKFVYHYSWIEGDALKNVFEKISYETKIEEHHGGSVTKITTKFFTIGDVHLEEEQLNAGKEKIIGLFKAVEAYVLANPGCA